MILQPSVIGSLNKLFHQRFSKSRPGGGFSNDLREILSYGEIWNMNFV